MSFSRKRVPSYRLHKPSGQARVIINGEHIYLGRYGSPESQERYSRLIAEMCQSSTRQPAPPDGTPRTEVSINELLASYWVFAQTYYRKNGKPTSQLSGIQIALRWLRRLYGRSPARQFGPLKLKALRQEMIGAGWSRRYVNDNIDRIRRMFKWAVGEEMIPPDIYQSLSVVPGLRKGRSEARETEPILPISDVAIGATLPHLPVVVADIVRFQRLTGCRPGEACSIRPCDVDTSGDVWLYRPETHKTEHHGRERTICIGPRAQEVLRPYLLRVKSTSCFSPADSERKRKAELRTRRKSKVQPSQMDRSRSNPKRQPGERYNKDSYRHAIHRACDAARIPRWSPNRLRHAAATEIRKRFGLEGAQVALGHASADVSQIYAERDLSKAAAIMRDVG